VSAGVAGTERQNANARSILLDGDDGTNFERRCCGRDGIDDKPNDVGGQEILLADLKNARSRGFGRGQDGSEVEIMRDEYSSVFPSPTQD
jgi:hypothetical protein